MKLKLDSYFSRFSIKSKIFGSILSLMFICHFSFSQNWVEVGPQNDPDLTNGNNQNLVFTNGNPHIAYQDIADGNKPKVIKFTGTDWQTLGKTVAATSKGVHDQSIQVVTTGTINTIYVAYQDSSSGNGPTVKKRVNNKWQNIGDAGFTNAEARHLSLLVYNNEPYVAFSDERVGYKLTVMKHDGSNWLNVGTAGFSSGVANYISLKVSNTGILHVAYQDVANSNKSTVKAFNGTSWVDVGLSGFSDGTANFLSMTFNASNEPIVAYQDAINSNSITVKKYDGTNWVNVGPSGFTGSSVGSVNLVYNNSGIPHVSFIDGARGNKVTVMQFNSTLNSWDSIGNRGFNNASASSTCLAFHQDTAYVVYTEGQNIRASRYNFLGNNWTGVSFGFIQGKTDRNVLAVTSTGNFFLLYKNFNNKNAITEANYITVPFLGRIFVSTILSSTSLNELGTNYHSLTADVSGNLYLAYQDSGKSNRISVEKFDATNSTWSILGSRGFSTNEASFIKIAVSPTNIPYVVYKDVANGSKTTVRKFNAMASAWDFVGTAGFSAGEANYQNIVFNGSDPYVTYRDVTNGNKATVMKYNGTTWQNVGLAGFTVGAASYVALAFNSASEPHVAFSDATNNNKTSVMKFNGTTWSIVGSSGFSNGPSSGQNIFIQDTLYYVAYYDSVSNVTGGAVTIIRYSPSLNRWVDTARVSGRSANLSLFVYQGTPFIAIKSLNGSVTRLMSGCKRIPPPINTTANATVCLGQPAVLTASGTAGGVISWYKKSATGDQFGAFLAHGNSYTTSPNYADTNYYVQDSSSFCGVSTEIIAGSVYPMRTRVSVRVNGTPPTITGNFIVCNGGSTTLFASGSNSYVWSNGQSTNSIFITPSTTQTYTVTGTDNIGCQVSATQMITVLVPFVSIAGENTICNGNNTTLVAGGSIRYRWSTGATTSSIVVNPSSNTTYSVEGTDVYQCIGRNSIDVKVNETPNIQIINGSNTICRGESIVLSASGGGNNYTWSNASTSSQITITPNSSRLYILRSTNSEGWVCSDSIEINVSDISANIRALDTLCDLNVLSLKAFSSGNGASYLWSTNETTDSITVTPRQNNSYSLIVSDVNNVNCKDTAYHYVVINPCVGINDLYIEQSKFLVYPNPTERYLTISTLPTLNLNAIIGIRLFDVYGKSIYYETIIKNDKIILDLEGLYSGLYHLVIETTNNQSEIVKINVNK